MPGGPLASGRLRKRKYAGQHAHWHTNGARPILNWYTVAVMAGLTLIPEHGELTEIDAIDDPIMRCATPDDTEAAAHVDRVRMFIRSHGDAIHAAGFFWDHKVLPVVGTMTREIWIVPQSLIDLGLEISRGFGFGPGPGAHWEWVRTFRAVLEEASQAAPVESGPDRDVDLPLDAP